MPGRQDEIATTSFVPRADKSFAFLENLSGFCGGAQAVKDNGLLNLRVGSLVYVQGTIVLVEGATLPVKPREDGYVQVIGGPTNVYAAKITKGSNTIDFTGIPEGTYYITGTYIAQARERV